MVSQGFFIVFILSIILNYLHGVECIKTKFWEKEPHIYFYTKYFKNIPQAVYFVKHVSLWIFLLMVFFLLLGGRWIFIPFGLYGTVFFSEFHHVMKAFKKHSYHSGMITSFFFPIVGILYWIELIKLWK